MTRSTVAELKADYASMSPADLAVEKRKNLMGNNLGESAEEYKDSLVHQRAAQTWAAVEVAEVTREQTAAINAQSALLERQIAVQERLAAATERHAEAAAVLARQAQLQNRIAFYTVNPGLFPAGVRSQLKEQLGILDEPTAKVTALRPAKVEPEPVPSPVDSDGSFDFD